MARQPLSYLFVSGTCLLLHNLVLMLADRAGMGLLAAVASSFAVVLVTGFLLHARLTFAMPMRGAAFLRYSAAMALNLPLAYFATGLWQVGFNLPMVWAAPLGSALMLIFNYFATRWALIPTIGSNHGNQ